MDMSKFGPVNLGITIADLRLGTRTARLVAYTEIEYLEDLVQKTEAEMNKIKGFGHKCMRELKVALAKHGLKLQMRYEYLYSISVLELPPEIEEVLREKAGIVRIHQLLDMKRSDLAVYLSARNIDDIEKVVDLQPEPPLPVVVVNPIQDLGLDEQINWVLLQREVVSINQLIELTEGDLLDGIEVPFHRTQNYYRLSESRIFQIESALARRGLTLKDSRFVRMMNTLTEARKKLAVQ